MTVISLRRHRGALVAAWAASGACALMAVMVLAFAVASASGLSYVFSAVLVAATLVYGRLARLAGAGPNELVVIDGSLRIRYPALFVRELALPLSEISAVHALDENLESGLVAGLSTGPTAFTIDIQLRQPQVLPALRTGMWGTRSWDWMLFPAVPEPKFIPPPTTRRRCHHLLVDLATPTDAEALIGALTRNDPVRGSSAASSAPGGPAPPQPPLRRGMPLHPPAPSDMPGASTRVTAPRAGRRGTAVHR